MRVFSKLGPLAAGTTLGGLVVGACEGAYRQAPLGYSALFYGALWAVAGTGLAATLAMLLRRRAPKQALHTWGLSLALGASALVLVRFIVFRDLFSEAPEKSLTAWGVALASALVAGGLVQAMGRWIRARFLADRLMGAWVWLVPLSVFIVFSLMTQAGDDDLATTPSNSARALNGKGVILVVVDTLRADALGAYGAAAHRGTPPSPHLDAFAKEGVLFRDVSAQASWTRPAVATLHTSRHASGHDTMDKNAVLPASLPTIASVLHDKGVKTGAVVTNYNLESSYGFARGFDQFSYLAPARYLGAPEAASRLAAYNMYRLLRERFFTGSREARYFYRSGGAVNAAGLGMLDAGMGDGDFFLWLHYMEPHDPYFAVDGRSYARVSTPKPPAAWAEDMRLAYKDNVRRFDDAFAELVQGLRARGLYDKVTLVVVSDHGEEFAEHGGFYHGTSLYEEQLDVPLIVRGQGIAPAENTTLARQLDVAPTILARFGVPSPESWEGRDLFGATPAPETTLAEEDHEGHKLRALRVGTQKLITANADNPRGLKTQELYDLATDPREQYQAPLPGATESLAARLKEAVQLAKKGGAKATAKALDQDAEAELRSLGYVQ